jgi:hypothetical protein
MAKLRVRGFLVKYASILILALQVSLTFSEVLSVYWRVGIGILAVLIFGANHWLSVSRPYQRFQRFETMKYDLLDELSRPMQQQYAEAGLDLRINMMRIERRLIVQEEPSREGSKETRLQFFTRCLRVEWVSPNMQQHGDRSLVFTTRQGVCGEAFQSGEVAFADLTEADLESYNLNREQIESTRRLRFVLSAPIRALDPETMRLTSEVIGVVNIDSRTNGAEQLIDEGERRSRLIEKIRRLAEHGAKLL